MDTLGERAARVRELITRFSSVAPEAAALDDGRVLSGGDGLGFDSVRLVELLLTCEDELGLSMPIEQVLQDRELTVGRLVALCCEARG